MASSSNEALVHPALCDGRVVCRNDGQSRASNGPPQRRHGLPIHRDAAASAPCLLRNTGLNAIAMARERQIKRWTRAKKEALIAGDTNRLHSLSKRRTR